MNKQTGMHLLRIVTVLILTLFCSCGAVPHPVPSDAEGPSAPAVDESVPASTADTSAEQSSPAHAAESPMRLLTAKTFSSSRQRSETSSEFRDAYAAFAVSLLRASMDESNTLVSPLSVLTALQMTANGAQGQTLAEMRNVLCGMDTEILNAQLFNYFENLKNTPDAKLEYANAVWVTSREDFKVNQAFIQLIDNTFRATVASAPFSDPATVDAINDWCSEHTDDMIEKVLEYDDVDYDTAMVLLNALCFDALWEKQYEEPRCRDAVFHGLNGDTTVTMMYSEESAYLSGTHETGFLKYYRGGNYAFVGLLPKEGMSLEEYLGTLTGPRLRSLMEGRGDVDVGLPKFRFDWSNSLVSILESLGIHAAFTKDADFSGLGAFDDGDPLYIGDVIHKTHIEVDESGTRAAAVTAVIMPKATSIGPADPKKVILDRPFVFCIVDVETKLPVFIGTVTDIPSAG